MRVEFECRGLGISESREVTDAIVAWAKAELEPAMKATHPECGIDFEEILDYPALDMAADAASSRSRRSSQAATSHAKVAFGTEASLFVSMADIPSVVIGPGAIAQAHKPDEFVEMAELEKCAGFMERLIAHCAKG